MITLQYLEPGPHISKIRPSAARAKLRAAFDILPIDILLLGWDIPNSLAEVCRDEAEQSTVKLFRWHPLLSSDGNIRLKESWLTRNLGGVPLSGFRGLPEFTFLCPNNPNVRKAVFGNLQSLIGAGIYDGIFLDRMRFPSPAESPVEKLACFCGHCRKVAWETGLDLSKVKADLEKMEPQGMLEHLFRNSNFHTLPNLSRFLEFREKSITEFVSQAVAIIRSGGLDVGLDCFSPSLTRMVGQNLADLASLADWTKIMTYGHAYGPATLPFELIRMVEWLMQFGVSESKALESLSDYLGFSLPESKLDVRSQGLMANDLALEYSRGIQNSDGKLLAGIELVEIPGVSELNQPQIELDLLSFKEAGVDGLSISWDLWHIPLERLKFVANTWL